MKRDEYISKMVKKGFTHQQALEKWEKLIEIERQREEKLKDIGDNKIIRKDED